MQNREEKTAHHIPTDQHLTCKLLTVKAQRPSRNTFGDAGFDLYACLRDVGEENMDLQVDSRISELKDGSLVVPPGARVKIPTGVSLSCPPNVVYRLCPRSGLAQNYGLDVLAGVIDSSYRGEIFVLLINHGTECWTVTDGAKICQIVPLLLAPHPGLYLSVSESLSSTERGTQGFGSSGY